MEWAKPPSDRALVNRAGVSLREMTFPILDAEVLNAVNAWRAAHAFPLNTFQVELRRRAKLACKDSNVVQRTKRLESVHAKLVDRPTMRLTQMQDIGGCRAVVGNLPRLNRVVDGYLTAPSSRLKHQFHHEKNYIAHPKADGYRSRHLVYQYSSVRKGSAWDGLFVEIQVRTRLQHAWATAVESVGTFTRQALKSNKGDERWRRFFALVSTAIAAIEQCPSVPGTEISKVLLIWEIARLEEQLGALKTLAAYQKSLEIIQTQGRGHGYYVIEMNFDERFVRFSGFKKNEGRAAQALAAARESIIREDQNIQVVLVAAGSINALMRAYPNYILDTTIFTTLLEKVLAGEIPDPQRAGQLAGA